MNSNIHTAEVVSPRAMLFVGIVALHAVLGYLLASGLMTTTIDLLKPKMEGVIIPMERLPPPEPRKTIEPERLPVVPLTVPEPDIPEITEVRSEPMFVASEQTAPDPEPVAPPVAVAEPPIRVVGATVFPNTDPYYPPAKRRTETEGAVLVRACVDENGRLNGPATLEKSSGFRDFDDAALRLARDTRYAKSMKGDVAVPNCHRFKVTFSMKR